MFRYYDIHAHLADARIATLLPAILQRNRERGLAGVLANAARLTEWPKVLELAAQPGVCAALGLHPFFLGDWSPAVPRQLRELLEADRAGTNAPARIRAIGEIGLDFSLPEAASAVQQRTQVAALEAQLAIAAEFALPVILHNRRSWDEFFGVWHNLKNLRLPGVCHHFTGSRDIARRLLDEGLCLSFCGPLTYPQSRRLRDVAAYVPLDRLLTETDTPDLPAAPFRGQWSEPWQVCEVVSALAKVRLQSETEIADQVEANFLRVLNLEPETAMAALRKQP